MGRKLKLIGASSKDGASYKQIQEQKQKQKQEQKQKLKAHQTMIEESKENLRASKYFKKQHMVRRATARITAKGIVQIRYGTINKYDVRTRDVYDFMMDKRINKLKDMEED
tara:strand:+ start:939 stop:1271 length:333 start_codon:yes stop_codon:yes gene_type:complete